MAEETIETTHQKTVTETETFRYCDACGRSEEFEGVTLIDLHQNPSAEWSTRIKWGMANDDPIIVNDRPIPFDITAGEERDINAYSPRKVWDGIANRIRDPHVESDGQITTCADCIGRTYNEQEVDPLLPPEAHTDASDTSQEDTEDGSQGGWAGWIVRYLKSPANAAAVTASICMLTIVTLDFGHGPLAVFAAFAACLGFGVMVRSAISSVDGDFV